MDYRIVDKEAFTVAGRSYQTTCKDGEQTRQIPLYWEECHSDGTISRLSNATADGELLGICQMQPDQETLTYTIAGKVGPHEKLDGLVSLTFPAYTWAVFSATGPVPEALQNLFCRIFQEWFPATGYEHAGGPELEVYPAGDTAQDDYRCEIWIPVVKK